MQYVQIHPSIDKLTGFIRKKVPEKINEGCCAIPRKNYIFMYPKINRQKFHTKLEKRNQEMLRGHKITKNTILLKPI